MGRHSLPDRPQAGTGDPRPRTRRRTVAAATALVLIIAGGTAAAAQTGLLSFGSFCRDDPVRLKLAASPELAPAPQSAADRARDQDVTSDGRCLDIKVTARDAYKVADALRAGKSPDAQIWVPDSDVWVEQVAAAGRATPVTTVGNVASTPVGVAVVPDAAKALGWPRKTYSWTELVGAALENDDLALGAADPARSATGLLALTRLGTAAARTRNGATEAAALMKALSQRVSDSDGQVPDTLPRDSSGTEQGNPRRIHALALTEQAAHACTSSADKAQGLGLSYPEDG